ncbi:MAG: ferrochelatase [Hellea sp.]|nr:ferrochelatase [Hellea sp.]
MGKKSGLLLVNLGSPDAPTPKAVRKYLFEFLHDKRVIETSRWIWCPILHGVILRVRPARSAKAYAKIWHEFEGREGDEAPLVRITRRQAEALAAQMGDNIQVDFAMRYGNPSISHAMDRLMTAGVENIAVLPLYPQYCGATTASVSDGMFKALKDLRDVPAVRILRDYHDDKSYISLLANSVKSHIKDLGYTPDAILASFHGIPQSYIDKGDPYQSECQTTVALLKAELGKLGDKVQLTFQSRFGPKQWLQPYTDKTLEHLAADGKTSVAVITPGFAADCLETLEEINMEARKAFLAAGGMKFSYIPCLNDDKDHVKFLANLSKKQLLAGWL